MLNVLIILAIAYLGLSLIGTVVWMTWFGVAYYNVKKEASRIESEIEG